MIARKEWFAAGRYGWKVNGWEGYAYFAVYALILIGIITIPVPSHLRFASAIAVLAFFLYDTLAILSELYPVLTPDQKKKYWLVNTVSFYFLSALVLVVFLYKLTVQDTVDVALAGLLIAIPIIKLILVRFYE